MVVVGDEEDEDTSVVAGEICASTDADDSEKDEGNHAADGRCCSRPDCISDMGFDCGHGVPIFLFSVFKLFMAFSVPLIALLVFAIPYAAYADMKSLNEGAEIAVPNTKVLSLHWICFGFSLIAGTGSCLLCLFYDSCEGCRCPYILMVVLGGLGWFASWTAYAVVYFSVPFMAEIPRQGWDVVGPTLAEARAFRKWSITGRYATGSKNSKKTYICQTAFELDVTGDATAVMPEIPDRYQGCFIGGFDLRFTLSKEDLRLSDELLYAVDFCKPVLWNWH
jgi:hypothetical protein